MPPTAQGFLYALNGVTLLLGALLLGFAIYVYVEFDDGGWSTFTSLSAVYAGIAAGVFTILVSFLGCAAAKKNQSKGLVFCYALLVAIILAIQIGAAVGIMQISGRIDAQDGVFSSELVAKSEIDINNAVLSVYTACCTGCYPASGCNNTEPFYAEPVENCIGQSCTLVGVCTGSNNATCYLFEEGEKVNIPPSKVDKTVCSALNSVKQNNTLIVGPANTGACGGGNPAVFKQNLSEYMSSRFYWVAVGFCVIAGIQGLVVLTSLWIFFCITRKDGK